MSRLILSVAALLTVLATSSAQAQWYVRYDRDAARLTIYAGEDGVDDIEVRRGADYVTVINHIVTGINGGYVFDRSEYTIDSIVFVGEDERDIFTNNTYLPSAIYGNGGDDSLTGGYNTDLIYGGEGIDSLFGRNGDDYLDPGFDFVEAEVYGGEDDDTIITYLFTWGSPYRPKTVNQQAQAIMFLDAGGQPGDEIITQTKRLFRNRP